MQSNLKCCGVNSYQDWLPNIPKSCCADPSHCEDFVGKGLTLITSQFTGKEIIYKEGCVDKVFDELKTEYGMYGAAVLAAIELIGVIFGCCLGARFGRKRYTT